MILLEQYTVIKIKKQIKNNKQAQQIATIVRIRSTFQQNKVAQKNR